jgi:hypothetical protein
MYTTQINRSQQRNKRLSNYKLQIIDGNTYITKQQVCA